MFTDMVGYTALGQKNESLSLALVEEQRKLIRPIIARHNGREIKTMGDAFLVEFQSALDAVRCAYDIQRAAREFNFSLPEDRRVHLRAGIHLGDVIESRGDISGDAVNVASRIEPLAEDGGVCISRQVYDHVQNKFELKMTSLGAKSLKNVSTPLEVYKMVMPWGEGTPSPTQIDKKRIAVLPFANMSPDPLDEYFADGMTEELISTMSKVGGLKIIARTSVMGYKGGNKKIDEIARELSVGTLIEGSVRKAGEMLRITVQLIDAQTSEHQWAETYDRELKDVFTIQSDISETVADALKVRLLSGEKEDIEKKPTENMDAYQLYLKGRYHSNRETREDYDKALKYFEEAVMLDPRFALAYTGISDYYHVGGHYNWFSPEEVFPKMKEYANKALEIDPNLAEGHAALGAVYFHYDWKWREAEKEITRAIELKPSDFVLEMYSYLLAILGRLEESNEQVRRAKELSPQFRSVGMGISGVILRFVKIGGISRLEEIVRANPDLAIAHDSLGFADYRASRVDEAISEMREAVSVSRGAPAFKADLAFLLALAGCSDEAESILSELKSISKKSYVSNVQMACIEYSLGRHDEAFEDIERAYQRRAIDLADIRMIPELDKLRADPRWISIETRMGLRNT
jgi:TolB-like protein/Flp pilus assembly protein TadD